MNPPLILPLAKIKSKKLRWLTRILICILIIPITFIVFLSPITKYCVEKYDVEYTGREISIDLPYVNLFTGYIHLSNVIVKEHHSDSLFFKAKGIGVNFSMFKLLSKKIELSDLTLDDLDFRIVQNKKALNLDDLISRFSSKPNSPSNKDPIKFSILSLKINNGELHYKEINTPVHVFVKKLFMKSSGIRWNSDTIASTYSFISGIGKGGMNGYFNINTKNLNYTIDSAIDSLDLNFINQYIKDLANYGEFKAILNAKLNTKGNFKDAQALTARGNVCVVDFHLKDHKGSDWMSIEKLAVGVTQLSPNNRKYILDSVLISKPYFKYEEYDHQNNIEAIFYNKTIGAYGSKNPQRFNLILEIGNYFKTISKNFFKSNYQINRLEVSRGKFEYNNFSLNEFFSISADPVTLSADSINKAKKMVELKLQTSVKPYGNIVVSLNINPQDSSDFDLTYHLNDLPLAMFNPYLISYTSFPVDRGTIILKGYWAVRNGYIKSTNHLLVIDPRISERIDKKNSKWIPLPLIMAFVRERGNVIDYEIPINGDMKHPDFNFKDVIWDALKNVFIKPATTRYKYTVKTVEDRVERSHSFKWPTAQYSLERGQKKFLKGLANYLFENPNAHLTVSPIEYTEKEREYILFFAAKKKYYLRGSKNELLDKRDSLIVNRISIKDPLFQKYITHYCNNPMLFTIQEKCYKYVGEAEIRKKLFQLRRQRQEAFRNYFKENKTNDRIVINSVINKIPYNGFSFYKIEYDRGVPESLNKAYERMAELNSKTPRKKYEAERRKNKNNLR